jgi:replicative DNA helicase
MEAEMSAIGCMLIQEEACDLLANKLHDADFYSPANREIFAVIQQLRQENRAVDMVTVKNLLNDRSLLNNVGGVEYLIQMAELVPSASNADDYAEIVMDLSSKRRLEKAGHDIVKIARDREKDIPKMLLEAENEVYSVGRERIGKEFQTVRELANDFFVDVDRLMETGVPATGVMTEFTDLDAKTTGFYPGDLVILASRPAMGKTSIALNFALEVAKSGQGAVAVFSLEMTGEQLVRRLIATLAKVPMGALKKPNLSDYDYQALADACDEIYRLPIFIDDTSGITPMALRAKCQRLDSMRRAETGEGIAMVVVDYLQLMNGSKKSENRNQEIGEIARSLKELAKDLKVPVLALCQVNRAVESRDDKRPTLGDMRESGSIEAEADIVMAIYRKSYYDRKESGEMEKFDAAAAEVAELVILKHRSGPTGTVLVAFQPAYTRFSDLDKLSKDDYWESLKGGGKSDF